MPAWRLRADLVLGADGRSSPDPIDIAGARIVDELAVVDETVDLPRRLLVPGLVNAHHHSNEAWHRGRFDRMPLEPWMLFTYPPLADPPEEPREAYVRTCLSAIEALRTGATCVVDFVFEPGGGSLEALDAVVAGYRDVGVRAVVVLGMADEQWRETVVADWSLAPERLLRRLDAHRLPSWGAWEAFARDAVRKHHRPEEGLSIGLGPSGPQRCSDEMLAGCASLAGELDLTVHIHVLETRMQVLTGLRRTGTTLPKHLDSLGFLSERVTFEHGIWLERDDIELLAERGVTVAHNPVSNLKLGSGICSVAALRAAGVCVSLGTDGTAANDGADMLSTLKFAALLHRGADVDPDAWLGAGEAWSMGTVGGAHAAGQPRTLGTLARGACADVVALDLDHAAFTPLGEPVHHMAYCAPAGAITDVMVNGRWSMRDGTLCRVNERELLAEARDIAPVILERRREVDDIAGELAAAIAAGWREVPRTLLTEVEA